ncbi:MAG: UDP-4-amino-4,6-dideoxy-N-acetyl-beta-L-altrosamine N-acetyltransferase [Bacteroidota bacterium]
MQMISGYGITLRPLQEDQLERIRNWRNAPHVAPFMTFKEYITPEMHRKWYEGINNDHNQYFLIYFGEAPLGVVHLKDIDPIAQTAEWGIYLGELQHRKARIGTKAALLLHHYGFETLQLRQIKATILDDNEASLRFHLKLGYQITPGHEDLKVQIFWLMPEDFISRKAEIEIQLV